MYVVVATGAPESAPEKGPLENSAAVRSKAQVWAVDVWVGFITLLLWTLWLKLARVVPTERLPRFYLAFQAFGLREVTRTKARRWCFSRRCSWESRVDFFPFRFFAVLSGTPAAASPQGGSE
jgi:hypothetical protein